jgi:hypothetical protein
MVACLKSASPANFANAELNAAFATWPEELEEKPKPTTSKK